MIRFKKVTQQALLLLTISLLAPLHPASGGAGEDSDKKRGEAPTEAAPVAATQGAPANGGAGAEPADTSVPVVVTSRVPSIHALGCSKNIVNRLRCRSLGVTMPTFDLKYLQAKIVSSSKQLAIAQAAMNHELASDLQEQITRLHRSLETLINNKHAPYRIAFNQANASLKPEADPRALLAAIPAEDLLNRMALCFAWYQQFPLAESLDINIPLNQIISHTGYHRLMLKFESINQVDNQEKIAQEIVNFVLAVMRPRKLIIDSAPGALAFVSYKLQTLNASLNTRLTSLDLSNCPQLKELYAYSNRLLTALDLSNCNQLQALDASNNPLLTELDLSNCTHLQKLNASSNPRLTTLDLSNCTQLQILNASNNPRLTTLDLSNCTHLQKLNASENPLLPALDLSNCHQLEILYASDNPLLPALDLSNCHQLEILYASENPLLPALDLSSCHQLKFLSACDNPRLTRLDLSNCHHLKDLLAYDNPRLTTLDLSNCHHLKDLLAHNSPRLTTLDLSNCTQLQSLVAHGNRLLTDLILPVETPRLLPDTRTTILAMVAANRARIAREEAEE